MDRRVVAAALVTILGIGPLACREDGGEPEPGPPPPPPAVFWAKRAGSADKDQPYGIAALSDGSVVVTGRYYDTCTFAPGEANETSLTCAGSADIFLARYEADGTLAWVSRAGGSGSDLGLSVAAGRDDALYATGWFANGCVFGPGEANETSLTSAGGVDVFLARYKPDGTLQWARGAGGTSYEAGDGVVVLTDGSAVVTGEFKGTATFGSGEANETSLTSAGGNDVFVACYGPGGTLEWAKRAGGTGSEDADSVAALSDGAAVVTGLFYETCTFGPGETNETSLTSAGGSEAFLACYDGDGELRWVRGIGGPGWDKGYGVAVLPDDSILVTGRFEGAATFDGGGEVVTSAGMDDIFLARYGPDGVLLWVTRAGGVANEYGHWVAALPDGGAVVTGGFDGIPTFGQGEANEAGLVSLGGYDVFLARYEADGTLGWAKRAAGGGWSEWAPTLTVLSDGSAVLTAGFQGTTVSHEGEPEETALTSAGSYDVLVARHDLSRGGHHMGNGSQPQAPCSLVWAKRAGGADWDSVEGLVVLSDDSVVVGGYFRGTMTLGAGEPGETILTSAGDPCDVFLARYGASGALLWAKGAGGTGWDRPYGVSVLSDDSVVITGEFDDPVTFGAGEPGETVLTPFGMDDIFVARYGPDGTLRWAKHAGGMMYDGGLGVAVLSDDSVLVTGKFMEVAVFGLGEPNETFLIGADRDVFLARYDPDGTLVWARHAGIAALYLGCGIASLSDDSALVTGRFRETATFAPGEANETILTAAGPYDIFLARYAADGSLIWAKRAGGEGTDGPRGTVVLSDDSVLVTGEFEGTATFNPGEADEITLTAMGPSDMFLAQYNPDGTLRWVKRDGGIGADRGACVAVLPDASVLAAGSFSGAPTFAEGEPNETGLVCLGGTDVFLAQYGLGGALSWVMSVGGGGGDGASGLGVLSDGSWVLAGSIWETVVFGQGEANETGLTSAGASDVFVARYAP